MVRKEQDVGTHAGAVKTNLIVVEIITGRWKLTGVSKADLDGGRVDVDPKRGEIVDESRSERYNNNSI